MSQFAFKRTGDADYPKYLKVLLQGPPKSGKTTFISTAPNVVVAACEAGLASIAHLDVPYVEVDGTDKLQNLEMILRDDALRARAAQTLGVDKIETVAIDTLDAWQEMLKKEILAENKRTQFQQADWGVLKERMSAIMKRFVSLPVNVIFTVHTSTTMDDESRMIYAPALQGSIKDEIAGYVDFSLLSFRQRETDPKGVAKISYYLKCEGDQKNPHLGNRAAGRLPEIVEPDFMTLHKAVFSAVTRKPRAASTPVETEKPQHDSVPTEAVLPAQPPAQTPSQPVVSEVTLPESQPEPPVATRPAPKAEAKAPTGVPADDPQGPITASGVSHVTKLYTEQGFLVPEDLKGWTLEKGRSVSKFFMAWKTDKANGAANATRDDLIAMITAAEAFAGEIPGVKPGVEDLKNGAKDPAVAAAQPTQHDGSPASTPASNSGLDDAEKAALDLVQDQLGATVVSYGAAEGAKCEVCDQPVDDQDIANLAVMKFKRPMCVKDYKTAVKAAKQ